MAKAGANSLEGIAAPFVERIENVMGDLASLKGTYMNECKGFREDIKEIVDEAKDAGVPKKALKGIVKYREMERKQAALADGMKPDDADAFETLVAALGQLDGIPLAEAAKSAAA